ncbi:hypothetical protein Sjap_023827 [Stephania japonica]|uniref:Bowman-Birk serine protease inhibitors family domain-containing protein n=1 Tax=Stephania japonica TaxID=461633 RepID=A0AAP0EEF0_9MAGN
MASTVKSILMIISLVLAIVFAASPVSEARLTFPSILMTSFGTDTTEIDCDGIACCDTTICLESCPPKCSCKDIREKCHAACKNCSCTKSIPPQCQCMDVTNYRYARCPIPK